MRLHRLEHTLTHTQPHTHAPHHPSTPLTPLLPPPHHQLLELAWLLKDGDYHQQPVKLRALALQQLCERTLLSIGEDVSAKYENLTEMVSDGESNLGSRPTSSRTTPSHRTHIHPHPRSRR